MNKFKRIITAVLSGCIMIGATAGITASAADGKIVVKKGVGYWVYESYVNKTIKLPTVIKNGGYYGINFRKKDRNGEYHVYGIQRMLTFRKRPCGTIDGIIGPKTDDAIKKFQKDCWIDEDGIVGTETYGRLVKKFDAQDKIYSYTVNTSTKLTTVDHH